MGLIMFTTQIHQTNKVALEPLKLKHLEGLYQAGKHPQVWQWVLSNYTQTQVKLEQWFTHSAQFNQNEQVVFAIIDNLSLATVDIQRILVTKTTFTYLLQIPSFDYTFHVK